MPISKSDLRKERLIENDAYFKMNRSDGIYEWNQSTVYNNKSNI